MKKNPLLCLALAALLALCCVSALAASAAAPTAAFGGASPQGEAFWWPFYLIFATRRT